ncbi:hypothetical protein IAT38_005878 [Cryptococcus sp. DSM 104549]
MLSGQPLLDPTSQASRPSSTGSAPTPSPSPSQHTPSAKPRADPLDWVVPVMPGTDRGMSTSDWVAMVHKEDRDLLNGKPGSGSRRRRRDRHPSQSSASMATTSTAAASTSPIPAGPPSPSTLASLAFPPTSPAPVTSYPAPCAGSAMSASSLHHLTRDQLIAIIQRLNIPVPPPPGFPTSASSASPAQPVAFGASGPSPGPPVNDWLDPLRSAWAADLIRAGWVPPRHSLYGWNDGPTGHTPHRRDDEGEEWPMADIVELVFRAVELGGDMDGGGCGGGGDGGGSGCGGGGCGGGGCGGGGG